MPFRDPQPLLGYFLLVLLPLMLGGSMQSLSRHTHDRGRLNSVLWGTVVRREISRQPHAIANLNTLWQQESQHQSLRLIAEETSLPPGEASAVPHSSRIWPSGNFARHACMPSWPLRDPLAVLTEDCWSPEIE